MKRILLIIIALFAFNALTANPVDVNKAQSLGQKFVNAQFEIRNRGNDIALAYTAYTGRNEACFYVFNVGNAGFVIISADDYYRPVIGYSENGKFDVDNVPPALQDYLEGITMPRLLTSPRTGACSKKLDV